MFVKKCKIEDGVLQKVRCSAELFEIPDSVTEIDSYAFYGSPALKSITIPDSVKSIGSEAFDKTAAFKDPANWTDGVLYIGKYLIFANKDIRVCKVREGTRCIADEAFAGCRELTEVILPESLITIGRKTFEGCLNLRKITFPAKMKCIGEAAFTDCGSLTEIALPNGLDAVADQTFDGCTYLTKVVIPDSVRTIGRKAFAGCVNLPELSVPFGAKIGAYAFHYCANLQIVRHTATRKARIGYSNVRNGNQAFLNAEWIFEE